MGIIRQAGGIGCFEKRTEEGAFLEERHFASDMTMDVDRPTKSNYSSSAAGHGSNHFKKQLCLDYSIQSSSLNVSLDKDNEEPRISIHGSREFQEDQRGLSRHKGDREYYSTSPEKRHNHGGSHEQTYRQKDLDGIRNKHHENKQSFIFSKHHDNRSASSVSNTHQKSNLNKRNTHKNYGSKSLLRNTIEDRYDPSKSHDICEDDVF